MFEDVPVRGLVEATRSVQTEVAMARQMSRGAAERQLDRALVLQHLPRVAATLADGTVSERVGAEVADEARHLDLHGCAGLDARNAPVLAGLTPKRAEHGSGRTTMRAWASSIGVERPAGRR